MKILTKVVVGSRLHGLDTPTSDWDYRGIHIHSLPEVLSPFKTLKNTTWIEGDEDNTSYELEPFLAKYKVKSESLRKESNIRVWITSESLFQS